MTTQYINETFEQAVEQLPIKKQLAFAYFLAKRMFPNYSNFVKKEEWGDEKVPKNALRLIYKVINDEQVTQEQLKSMIDNLSSVTPDTDDFGTLEASLALDACVVLLETLESIKNQDIHQLSSIASLPFNSLRMLIEDRNNTFDDFHIDNDPLMLDEIQYQTLLIDKLKNVDEKKILQLIENER